MLKQVAINELQVGMYVNQVLEQTGAIKVRSKGLVKSQELIENLKRKGIKLLEVDLAKSKLPKAEPQEVVEPKPVQQEQPKKLTSDSLGQADTLYSKAKTVQRSFLKSLQNNTAKNANSVNELASSLIDSVFDNRDALCCLTMIEQTNEYLLEHSINCSVLMGIFADHLGYDRDTVEEASLGALLMDIGMSTLPKDILTSEQVLNENDTNIMRTHVSAGIEMLEQCDDISDLVLHIIEQHHERIDGGGYPKGLIGEDIEPLARAAAIVDSYDAMISNRPYKKAITPSQALKRLHSDKGLDQSLVTEFIKCIGIHPVGSLVKLRSGKLGIIAHQNEKDILSPVVMTFYSITGEGGYREIKRLDLSHANDEIVSGVRPEEFNLNLGKFFRDVFINQLPD